VPYEGDEHRSDFTTGEELDLGGATTIRRATTGTTPERASQRMAFLPSSIGVSMLVPGSAEVLRVEVDWGDYPRLDVEEDDGDAGGDHDEDDDHDNEDDEDRPPRGDG